MYAKESINFTSTMQVKFSVILSEVWFYPWQLAVIWNSNWTC